MKRFRKTIRWLLLIAMALAAVFLSGCTQPEPEITIQPRPYRERPTVAVVEFENRTYESGLGWGMADMLESALIRTQRYKVISRRQWAAVLHEQMLQDSFVDPETAVRAGRLIGAKYLITGSVNQALVEPVDVSLPNLKVRGRKASVGVTLQVIDVETGIIVDAPEAYGSATSATVVVEDVRVGSSAWTDTLLGKACRDAIDKLVDRLVWSF